MMAKKIPSVTINALKIKPFEDGQKNHKCQQKNKANEVSLKEHEIIHTGEKQFSCTHCNNEIPEEMHWKEHDIYPTYSGSLIHVV